MKIDAAKIKIKIHRRITSRGETDLNPCHIPSGLVIKARAATAVLIVDGTTPKIVPAGDKAEKGAPAKRPKAV